MNSQIEQYIYKRLKENYDKGQMYVSERPERLSKLVSDELGVIVPVDDLMLVLRQMKADFKISIKYYGQFLRITNASNTPKEYK